jgi:hypothetical protein
MHPQKSSKPITVNSVLFENLEVEILQMANSCVA